MKCFTALVLLIFKDEGRVYYKQLEGQRNDGQTVINLLLTNNLFLLLWRGLGQSGSSLKIYEEIERNKEKIIQNWCYSLRQ